MIGNTGGISSSSDSDNPAAAAPLYCRPFTLAGRRTISGVSAYDLGSVRGRSTRLPGTGDVLPGADGDGAAGGGNAGVMVNPEFWVSARRSRAVAGVMVSESRPELTLRSTTLSSTSIRSIMTGFQSAYTLLIVDTLFSNQHFRRLTLAKGVKNYRKS